jgi:16S rRNA processing protein RimM
LPKRPKRKTGAATDSPLPPCGGARSAGGLAEGGESHTAEAAPSTPEGKLLLGEIGAAQGLKGEVRLRSYTQEPTAIADYGPLEDERGRAIEIESVRVTPKALIARIKGATTREAAEALARTKLYIARTRLPARDEEEWYHADLIGLSVFAPNGTALGTVAAIHNFGAGDLIEIEPASGAPALLVPFTRDHVPEVDVEGGRLTVVLPEELEE